MSYSRWYIQNFQQGWASWFSSQTKVLRIFRSNIWPCFVFCSNRQLLMAFIKLMLEFLQALFLYPTLYLLYINDLDDFICNIAIYADDTTLYSKCDQESELLQQYNWLLNLNLISESLWTGSGSGLLISMLEKSNRLHLTVPITPVLLMWKWMGLLLRENHLLRCCVLTFSSKLEWGSYIISVAKITSKKIGALIHFAKFLSSEVALYLYESTIQSFLENC